MSNFQSGHENVVWSADDGENVVWGADDGENVVWSADDGENVVWGVNGDDTASGDTGTQQVPRRR